jgi:hypothetical protein
MKQYNFIKNGLLKVSLDDSVFTDMWRLHIYQVSRIEITTYLHLSRGLYETN